MYPADDVMHALCVLCRASQFRMYADGMAAVVPEGLVEVTGDQLDELLAREWVELAEGAADELRVTDAGRYWAGRWRAWRDGRGAR